MSSTHSSLTFSIQTECFKIAEELEVWLPAAAVAFRSQVSPLSSSRGRPEFSIEIRMHARLDEAEILEMVEVEWNNDDSANSAGFFLTRLSLQPRCPS